MNQFYPEVQALLEKHLQSLGILEYTLDIEDNNEKGDNYLGLIRKILIKGRKNGIDDVEIKWIAKCAPQIDSYRKLTHIDLAYEREGFVYKELFPIFDKFQNDRFAIDSINSFPTYITSYTEPYKETIVLEDMKHSGFIMKDRKDVLDLDHVKLVMKTYGKLHAISYAIKDQDPTLFKDIKLKTREVFFAATTVEAYQAFDDKLNAKAIKSLDPEKNREDIEMFERYSKSSARVLLEVLKEAFDDEYSVVCHGDCWITNMLFKYKNTETSTKPVEVCLLDFQLARFGSPAFDLSYFLFTCTDQSFRNKYYDQMINIYYYSLCAQLADLGSDPEKLLPFSVLKDHLKKYSVFGYGVTKSILFLMLSDSKEIPDAKEKDFGADLSTVFFYETKDDSLYLNRIKGVIEDFVAKGYFDVIDSYQK